MAEPKRSWTYIPPAWSGQQVEGTSFLPIGRYKMPDGSEQVSFGLPQPMLDAVRSLGYASGRDQDPNAPQGYVSQNALMKGGMGLAESAMVGGLAARAPKGAIRSGMARNAGDLDPSPAARMARAKEMGFEDQTHYRGMDRQYDPNIATYTPQWFSTNPEVGSSYAMTIVEDKLPQVMPAKIKPGNMVEIDTGGSNWDYIPIAQLPDNIRQYWPESMSRSGVSTNAIIKKIQENTYDNQPVDVVRFKNINDHAHQAAVPSDVSVVLNPANIRSTNAMFDPARINETDPLAAHPLAGAVPLMWQQDRERR